MSHVLFEPTALLFVGEQHLDQGHLWENGPFWPPTAMADHKVMCLERGGKDGCQTSPTVGNRSDSSLSRNGKVFCLMGHESVWDLLWSLWNLNENLCKIPGHFKSNKTVCLPLEYHWGPGSEGIYLLQHVNPDEGQRNFYIFFDCNNSWKRDILKNGCPAPGA